MAKMQAESTNGMETRDDADAKRPPGDRAVRDRPSAVGAGRPGSGRQRVALALGNAVCAHAPRLTDPLNDAADIAAALDRLGFPVTRFDKAGYGAMRRGLRAFTQAASTRFRKTHTRASERMEWRNSLCGVRGVSG